MEYYPVVLKLAGQPCLVVGGGAVAQRKVSSLLGAGAKVRVVAPSFAPALDALGARGGVELVRREYRPQDLEGAVLVIAATDDRGINQKVSQEARSRGILVNVVDSPQECSFLVPSVVSRGGLLIAISTGGRSPALARHLREKLEKELGEEYALLLELLGEARRQAQARGESPTYNGWRDSLEPALELLRQGKKEEARSLLLGKGA